MTFIISDVGSNFTSFEDAKDSIAMAARCGADAVKFQYNTSKDLFAGGTDSVFSFPLDWLPKLKEKADACKVEFMCTAFSPEGLKAIDPYVKRHKIASSDINYWHLLNVSRETRKPLILSCGASSINDIKRAINALQGSKVTLLYCNSAYPSTMHNLFMIDELRETFKGVDVGFSDHSMDIYSSISAAKHFRAVVIEKHFKLREMFTPDSEHSLNPEQFKEMTDFIRGKTKAHLGTSEEREMFLKHNRRLVAVRDIAVGERLEFGKTHGAYRVSYEDTAGINPMDWQVVEGKAASKSIKQGESIGPDAIHAT